MTGTLLAGLADPTLDSQRLFRAALEALSRPGRIVTLPDTLPDGPPAPLMPATAALALALFDYETPVWLDEVANTPAVCDWLRFHCGCPLVTDKAAADFAIIAGALPDLSDFPVGSDAFPDRSATLLVQVAGLEAGGDLRLSGPGIDGDISITIKGLPDTLPTLWEANQSLFPCGLDLLLTAGSMLLGLPRTTRIDRRKE
ncbi:MAG: phosphonate C-P lyase system protein PhnH [Alphaproteobacteria bacterium]|nr:phosphonate C-P lyase system protein PhnH [Alphaproteobacteria bacterium]MBU0797945.1 phosphonate C-P lyase system protein PhnH [Alphaproteobacteria bacterium]MBU0886103.1 phosphonate C-P lyase system protein PhnH [Alphaproteobacteria bacterium]MBU1812743.1 phosphonate C-P lyase system protein PhnH [Alphaproteobacteria bacterium]